MADRTINLTLSLFSVAYVYLIFFHYPIEPEFRKSILINAALSLAAFLVTLNIIPILSRHYLWPAYDRFGIAVGMVFLVFSILFQQFHYTADSNWLVLHNAALYSITLMVLLGFVADVINLPWRVMLILQSIAASPLLMAYSGSTTINISKPLIPYVGQEVLDLGWTHKLFIGILAVLYTNSLNVHAGFNGLEVGWTVIAASAILIHNIVQIGASADSEHKMAHAFSMYLAQPLLATSLALLSCNRYPSFGFAGNAYASFAGMTVAALGILGHFSEMVLMFVLPQIALLPRLIIRRLSGNVSQNKFHKTPEKPILYHPVFQVLTCGYCFALRYFLANSYD